VANKGSSFRCGGLQEKKTLVKKGVFLFKASFLPPQVIVGITVKTEMIF
jgi:hypothetical protein